MLTHPIIDQLTTLKMTGMAEALREQFQEASSQELPFETRLSLLVDREHSVRTNRALTTRLRMAKLHISHANMADIDYHSTRKLDKHHIATLATGQWLEQRQNILITGATGTGKSYLACALAHKACLLGYKARYWRLTRLLEELDLAKADGRYLNLIKNLAKFHVLVLDDWAMTKLQSRANKSYWICWMIDIKKPQLCLPLNCRRISGMNRLLTVPLLMPLLIASWGKLR